MTKQTARQNEDRAPDEAKFDAEQADQVADATADAQELREAVPEYQRVLPNMKGVATDDLVEKVQGGNFQASYINWSRTMQMLRDKAPDWMPELVPATDGGFIHVMPGVGAALMIRFRNMANGTVTPAVPQAIMDNRNNSVPLDKISARDFTDTHRRGVCMAAAFTFGLAYELWAKMPLESAYSAEQETKQKQQALDPVSLELAIQNASTLDELHKVFALAWRSADGNPAQQNKYKGFYDGRKVDFEEG